jgi:hypothetical protein
MRVEDADEDYRAVRGMLQELKHPDHFACEQPVDTPRVQFVSLAAERLRPRLGPGRRLRGQIGDAVDEHELPAAPQAVVVRVEPCDVAVVAGRKKPA